MSNQGAMCNTSSGPDGDNDKPLEDVRRGGMERKTREQAWKSELGEADPA
jgi:hypothetical protein